MSVWLATITDALDGSGNLVTLRYSSGEYDGDAYPYLPDIQQPALLSVTVSGLSILPSARAAGGEMTLQNLDRTHDYLADYAVDGRAFLSQFVDDDGVITDVFSGTVRGAPIFDGNIVSIRVRDAREALEQPHPLNVYAGTNVPPAGVEGTASDLKGVNKPKAWGRVLGASPKLVNVARQIYQAHDQSTAIITGVYDGGVAFTAGAPYPDAATLQSTSPAAGTYRTYQGYFRLGALPTREVTCDVHCGYMANASFEEGATGWTLAGTGTVAIANDPGNAYSPPYVLTRTGTDGVDVEIARSEELFTAEPGVGYPIKGAVKCSTAAGGAGTAEIGYAWLNASLVEIGATRLTWSPATTYSVQEGICTAPVGTVYARVSIVTRAQTTGTWYFDSLAGGSCALGDMFGQLAADVGYALDAADRAAANLAGEVGLYLTEPRPTAELFDWLAVSYGGFWGEQGGVLRLKPLIAPVAPATTIEDFESGDISRESTGAGPSGLPFWKVVVKGDRIETVQADVPGAPNPARLASQYREVVWEDAAVKARHPLAEIFTVETCLRNLSSCQVLANRLGALLSVRRDSITDAVRFSDGQESKIAALLQIGAQYTRVSNQLGYSAGRSVTVLGFGFDAQRLSATFNSWG